MSGEIDIFKRIPQMILIYNIMLMQNLNLNVKYCLTESFSNQ